MLTCIYFNGRKSVTFFWTRQLLKVWRLSKFLKCASETSVQDAKQHCSPSIISMACITDTLVASGSPSPLLSSASVSTCFLTAISAHMSASKSWVNTSIIVCSHEICRHNCLHDINHARVAFLCQGEGFIMASSSCVSCSSISRPDIPIWRPWLRWTLNGFPNCCNSHYMIYKYEASCQLSYAHFVHNVMHHPEISGTFFPILSHHALKSGSVLPGRWQPAFADLRLA